MRIFKYTIAVTVILSLIVLACTNMQKNKPYFEHLNTFSTVYENASKSVYPNQNFIYLDRILVATDKDENRDILPLTSASGIAVKSYKEEVYAFTAGHWCAPGEEIDQVEFLKELNPEITFEIENRVAFYGRFYKIETLNYDIKNDICVIMFKSEYSKRVKKIKIAKSYPRIGEKVYTASSPLGMFQHELRLIFEGYFAGCDMDDVYCFYTIPGINGSSGSGVLNSKGQLVSILDVSIIDFNHITGGAKIENIREMYYLYIP